jgi:hypothetical protein
MQTTFDPAVIDTNLYLWFGGRDYLHPYRLVAEDEISPSFEPGIPPEYFYGVSEDPGWSDDWTSGFLFGSGRSGAKQSTEEAEKTHLITIAQSEAHVLHWADLSSRGARLKIIGLPDGRLHLVLVGVQDGSAEAQSRELLCFVRSASGRTFVYQDVDLTAKALRQAFPGMVAREVAASTIWGRLKPHPCTDAQRPMSCKQTRVDIRKASATADAAQDPACPRPPIWRKSGALASKATQ